MKLKKVVSMLLMLVMLMVCFTGCGKKEENNEPVNPNPTVIENGKKEETPKGSSEEKNDEEKFRLGEWDGYTFKNEWMGLQIQFPEDIYIMDEDDMKELLGDGEDILVNNGMYTEAEMKISAMTTAYDFAVTLLDGVSSIQLMHENVSLATLGKGISEEDYMEILRSELETLEELGYSMGETEWVEFGGFSFLRLPISVLDGILYQDYYCRSQGKYISAFIVTYLPEEEPVISGIFNGITSLD